MPPSTVLLQYLGISLLLGLLVGLQRERTTSGMPGLRTFPLITVFGTVSGILADQWGGWVIAAGLLGMVAVFTLATVYKLKQQDPDQGTTTDVAMLLMFAVGALLVVAPLEVGIAVGGGVAVLLQFKPEMHRFAERLGNADLKAIMQFVLITCIVLPVLPDQTYDPLGVINPFETWLMVVLIVGMSLGGYIAYKFLGRQAGVLLGGLLGGAVSSTATTVSYARQARVGLTGPLGAAVAIMVASTVVFVRVLVEIAVVAPEFLYTAGPPVLILMLLTAIPAIGLWYWLWRTPAPMPTSQSMPEHENPTQLKSAVLFGLMYAVVLFLLAAAKRYFSGEALYLVAGLSGLTDMDAITLSTARMSYEDPMIASTGWRLIVVAALANLVFKAGMCGVLGSRRLLGPIVLLFLVPCAGGLLLLLFWPAI